MHLCVLTRKWIDNHATLCTWQLIWHSFSISLNWPQLRWMRHHWLTACRLAVCFRGMFQWGLSNQLIRNTTVSLVVCRGCWTAEKGSTSPTSLFDADNGRRSIPRNATGFWHFQDWSHLYLYPWRPEVNSLVFLHRSLAFRDVIVLRQ